MKALIPMFLRAIATSILVLLAAAYALAQDLTEPEAPDFYLGLYGGYGSINHSADLRAQHFNPRIQQPSDAALTDGSGSGVLAGLLFELPFSRVFSLGLRAGYQARGGTLETVYTSIDDVANSDGGGAQVRSSLNADLGYIAVTPIAKITPTELPLYLLAGPTVLFNLAGTYDYTETIEAPPGATFRDNDRSTRVLARGDLPTAGIVPALTAGVGIDLALSRSLGLFLELQYTPTLSNILDNPRGGDWTNASLAVAGGLRFGLFSEPEPVRPVVTREEPRTIEERRMRAGAVINDSTLAAELVIQGGTVRATQAFAFLPYLFFAKDSSIIPARYNRIDRRASRDFDIARIDSSDALGLYYHLLNIIGQRMRDNRQARVTVTGCSSNAEGNDTALARRRAEAVRDYLVEMWRINRNRLEVVPRGLPANPTLSEVDTAEGDRENQRVEFASTHYEVLAPIRRPDTLLLAPAGRIRFFPPTVDTTRIDSWALSVMVGDSLIENVETGYGAPPASIDFVIENRPDLDFAAPTPVVGRLIFRDTLFNQVGAITSDTVTIIQRGTFVEERNAIAGQYVDTYTLLLYSFDSDAILDFTQQATILMRSRINERSAVRVIGYTDRIGLPYYNQALSLRRAEVASQNLGMPVQVKELRGMGEKKLLYDNAFPEGRYYCRTVSVIIETPIATAEVTRR